MKLTVSKMSSGLYTLCQMSKICTIKPLKTIYFLLIHSHMASVISIYGATTNTNMSKILLQQKETLKIIFHLKRKETVPVHHLFSDLRILSV